MLLLLDEPGLPKKFTNSKLEERKEKRKTGPRDEISTVSP